MHLLCGTDAATATAARLPAGAPPPAAAHDELLARIEALEARVAALEAARRKD
jgi:uncharacterized protein YceH (UPF0502 family)